LIFVEPVLAPLSRRSSWWWAVARIAGRVDAGAVGADEPPGAVVEAFDVPALVVDQMVVKITWVRLFGRDAHAALGMEPAW
jgi:hypothetical protein